jgi:hypothetical protein
MCMLVSTTRVQLLSKSQCFLLCRFEVGSQLCLVSPCVFEFKSHQNGRKHQQVCSAGASFVILFHHLGNQVLQFDRVCARELCRSTSHDAIGEGQKAWGFKGR